MTSFQGLLMRYFPPMVSSRRRKAQLVTARLCFAVFAKC
jgi:hypothetical protein